jgi:hypothetical protein
VSCGSRPNFGPLSRTLLRLRHDLVIIGRTAARPLSPELLSKLSARISAIGSAVSDYLLASATALGSGRSAPGKAQVDAAMSAYFADVSAIRAAGLLDGLSANDIEQLFTLCFAFDQLRNNLTDLERCVREWKGV